MRATSSAWSRKGLEVARIESGKFAYDLRPLALKEEVERTVGDLTMPNADRVRVFAEPGLPVMRGDPDRNRHVLTNLLSNALKFSPPDTTVEVELTHRDSVVEVAVRDHGQGIEPSDLPKLFRKFSRVGTPEQLAVEGSGLGLYISRAMVEAQGGRIWVHSEPGRGPTFAYTLPADALGGG